MATPWNTQACCHLCMGLRDLHSETSHFLTSNCKCSVLTLITNVICVSTVLALVHTTSSVLVFSERAMERDKFMSAEEAVAFGLIDHVVNRTPLHD